jgi:hypothetical protein
MMAARMLRSVVVARLAVIVALAAALAVGGGVAGGRSVAKPIEPRNKIAAQDDAKARLGALSLPADATRSTREPGGDVRTLADPLSGPPATPNVVT